MMKSLILVTLVLTLSMAASTDWIHCVQAVIDVTNGIKQLETDAQAEDWVAVVKDLNKLQADINTVKTECNLSFLPVLNIDTEALKPCATEIIKIKPQVMEILEAYKENGQQGIMFQVLGLMGQGQKVKDVCYSAYQTQYNMIFS